MTHRHLRRPALLATTTTVLALVTALATAVAPANAEPRIAGGSTVPVSAVPWQSELLVHYPDDTTSECGAVLVHPSLVLTSADCVLDADGISVTLGADTFGGGTSIDGAVYGTVANYDPATSDNDFALVVLATPFTQLPPIAIAGPGEGATWRAGRTGLASGYGQTTTGGQGSQTLQAAQVPILADSVCTGSYNNYRPATQLCGGRPEGGSGPCPGDDGGPLAVPVDGGYRLAGLFLGGGAGCAPAGRPFVFTRVADPAVGARIQQIATELATNNPQYFPGAYANPQVLGSGAVPAGCTAARGAAVAAAGAVAGPSAALAAANAVLAKAAKKLKKAKKTRRSAAIKKAKKKQKAAAGAVGAAAAAVGAAQARAGAAAGGATAACS